MKASIFLGAAVIIGFSASNARAQGALTPPAPPAPTFKTLQQVEPRTPITNLPITISSPGSYYFISNLTGTASGGLTVSVSGVTLDLMGFELVGGNGAGIFVTAGQKNISIRNGTVRNWGGDGVIAASSANSLFQDLRLFANSGDGLQCGTGVVVNCVASGNQVFGFFIGAGSVLEGCSAIENGSDGFNVGPGSTIHRCVARGNHRNGISASAGSTVIGCTANNSSSNGIIASAGCSVVNCTAGQNVGDGIQANGDTHITGNNCFSNGSSGDGAGIHATSSDNRVDSNNVTDNDWGILADIAGNLIIRNSASGNTTNFQFTGVQSFGPTNLVTGVVTNHPWANFSY